MVAVGLDGAVRTGMWIVKGNALFLSEDRPPDRSRAPFRFHLMGSSSLTHQPLVFSSELLSF